MIDIQVCLFPPPSQRIRRQVEQAFQLEKPTSPITLSNFGKNVPKLKQSYANFYIMREHFYVTAVLFRPY